MKDDSRMPQKDAPPLARSRALETAFRMLGRRDHTRRELTLKLHRKGFGRQVVDSAILRCRELGYLDDEKTARIMADRPAGKGYGPLRIRQALKQKGLDEALVEKAMAAGNTEKDQVHAARKVLQKKASRLNRESDPWKRRQIAYRFLSGRGFPSSIIKQAIDDT